MSSLICINKKNDLTVGEMYEVYGNIFVPFSSHRWNDPCGLHYYVKCDDGSIKLFDSVNFRELTLSEKRDLKLGDILNGKES